MCRVGESICRGIPRCYGGIYYSANAFNRNDRSTYALKFVLLSSPSPFSGSGDNDDPSDRIPGENPLLAVNNYDILLPNHERLGMTTRFKLGRYLTPPSYIYL